jgi:integrase
MSQLFSILRSDFQLPEATDAKGNILYSAAGNLPTLCWPDGRWCFEANAFLLAQNEKRLSLRNGGGTLKEYAGNISHLLRFASDNGVRLEELSDSHFTLFVKSLMGERRRREPGVARRNSNSTIAICRLNLEFLDWLGRWRGEADFIGPEGRIRAERRQTTARKNDTKVRKGLQWHHRSFPTPDPYGKRRPITRKAMNQLGDIVASVSSSMFLRRRRYVMLKLFEITGGRRSEVSKIRVADVLAAAEMRYPMLRLICAKRRGGKEALRTVPVSRQDVLGLKEFVETARKQLLRSLRVATDSGYLLISETSGEGLRPNTLTQEISLLRKAAGFSEQACAHMFRHRFATKMFVALAEHHRVRNKDEFRQLFMSSEKLKNQVAEWLGQLSIESLDTYLDYAFEEVSGFKEVVDVVLTRAALDSFSTSLTHLRAELVAGAPPTSIIDKLLAMTGALVEEIDLRTAGG